MTTGLSMVIIWYLGALIVFWQSSIQYRNGTTLGTLAPFVGVACLMLVTASAIYYDYVDAPLYHIMSYFWYVFGVWVLYIWYRTRQDRIRK